MNRREFTKTFGLAATAFAIPRIDIGTARKAPQLAITIDDFNWNPSVRLNPDERNAAMLNALRSHGNLKAALFVAGKNADSEKGKRLLQTWDEAGHLIGNHSYSHKYLHNKKLTAEEFNADILKCETLIKDFRNFRRLFRFPYLKEGESAAKRDQVRAFLKSHGYHTGHVTIDASDWAVEDRLSARLTKEPNASVTPYRDFYLQHMLERALYYDDLSRRVLGRSVKHTILLHYNLLNALFLNNLLDMFEKNGWKLIDAQDAFNDPVFQREPQIVPAGESLIWALAKETGKFERLLRYPGEDSTYEDARMNALGL